MDCDVIRFLIAVHYYKSVSDVWACEQIASHYLYVSV